MSEDSIKLREAVAAKIRGLMAKTVENGATEAEAMSAAAKAREIMDRYRLSMSDVQIQAEPVERVEVDRPNENKIAAVDYTLHGIDCYCGVKSWYTFSGYTSGSRYRDNRVRKVAFLGLRADVAMATWLYKLIAAAIER